MANPEHLEILNQGLEAWNKWRLENPSIEPDLTNANLENVDLSLDVYPQIFTPYKTRPSVVRIHFGLNLRLANLRLANLTGANLYGADLSDADMTCVNLSRGALQYANLHHTNLHKANFFDVLLGGTRLSSVDLTKASGLEKTNHREPSTVGTDTLQISEGKIPESFLRGCGLSDWEIESAKLYNPDLSNQETNEILYRMYELRASQALQISPLFISYSHADTEFVDIIEAKLSDQGIRFWRDVHHATAGRLEKVVDRAIELNPTLLVILSENSTKSDWVEHEVRTARGLEKELGRDVLCPIALDDSWKTARWPARIMEQIMEYNILDFSGWQDEDRLSRKFGKLIDGLDIFYK